MEPPFTPDKIHKTLIRPDLLYGSETWKVTKRENQLIVFERKLLQTICGPKIEIGVYRRRYNHELDRDRQPECPSCHEDNQIALRWSHDQKTRRLSIKSSIQSQTQCKEKSRKTKIQVGGWGEHGVPFIV
jgi:hypothetical protein